jgi:cell division transport system permease protein
MNRLKLVVSESLRSLGANLSTTVAATMTVLIGMFLLGLFIALGTWVVSWSDHVKRELLVRVYFQQNATPQQINAVRVKLQSDPHVKTVKFVSAADALRQMQQRYPDLTQNLPSNPLPASEEVTPVRGEYVDAIDASLKPLPAGVDSVKYGKHTAHRVLQVAKVIELVFLVAVIVLLVASTILIANTIRLSIFSRRREIEVMKLVGATNWFVRGPFMLEGLLCGVAGALAAVILLVLAKALALPAILPHINAGSDVHAMSFSLNALILLCSGLLLGAAGSGVTLRRFLKV